ncbi:MAG: TM2 domain-containing protein [Candidatus Omnitrophota bacterium]
MKCIVHGDRESIGVCTECGNAICEECKVSLEGKNYCKKCLDSVIAKQKQEASKQEKSPTLAAVLSFIIGGMGQIYNGQVGKGILIFLTSWLIIPWIIGIFDAYNVAKKINEGKIISSSTNGCLVAAIFIIAIFSIISMMGLLAAIAIPNLMRARHNAGEASAIASLRNISVACESFRVAESKAAYPASLAALGATTQPYIDTVLASGRKQGYDFSYKLVSPNRYTCTATPVTQNVTGTRVFFVDETGVIRLHDATGPPIE